MVAFAPGAVLTAANLNTAFNALTIRTVTGVSDTLVLADNGGGVTYSNASATTSTIPPNSSVAFAVGTKIVLINLGAGVVTVTAGAGVTVNGTLTIAQDAGGTCIKTATNTWSFLPFSSGVGAADFSDTATGTYTGFKYLTFTSSGTITVTTAGFADVFICAGGGGASNGAGGGGGCLAVTSAYFPVGTFTVSVGAGGPAPANGTASQIYPFAGVGGGAGGAGIGRDGGSGGGGAGVAGGSGLDGQGFAGATGGGGGGAGAVGSGATGGAGKASTLTNTSVTKGAGGSVPGALGGTNTGDGGGQGPAPSYTSFAGGSGYIEIRVAV